MTSFASAYYANYAAANTRYDYSARQDARYRGGVFAQTRYMPTYSGYVYGNFNNDNRLLGKDFYESKYSLAQARYTNRYSNSYTYNRYRTSGCISDYYIDQGRMVPSQYCRFIAY